VIDFQFIQKNLALLGLVLTATGILVYRFWDHLVRIRLKPYWAVGMIGTPNELTLCVDVVNLGKPSVTVNCSFAKDSGVGLMIAVFSPKDNKYLRQNETASFSTGWNKNEKLTKYKIKVILIGSSKISFWSSVGPNNKKKWHVGRKDKEYGLSIFQVRNLNKELKEIVELNKPKQTDTVML
jgi:hypothetical protein